MKGEKGTAIGIVTVKRSTILFKVLLALFIIIMIVFTILIAPKWVDTVLNRNRSTLTQQLGFPLFLGFLLFCIILIYREMNTYGRPEIYGPENIESQGHTYSWQWVSCLYVNRYMHHMVLLFQDLIGPTRIPGLIIPKRWAEPSPEALIKLAEAKGVRIERKLQFSEREFQLLWSGRSRGDVDRDPLKVIEEQERQTFRYMVTHWPDIAVLILCSIALAVLIPYVFLAMFFIERVISGTIDAGFASYFLKFSIVMVVLGIPALVVFRLWRKWSKIPVRKEPPMI